MNYTLGMFKLNNLSSVLMHYGNYDKIQRQIKLAKANFKKLNKVLKDWEITLETKQRLLSRHIMSTLLYVSECWTSSSTLFWGGICFFIYVTFCFSHSELLGLTDNYDCSQRQAHVNKSWSIILNIHKIH